MKPLTLEWIQKAEGDFITARREYSAPKEPNYDAACFHAQQCAEKYLKARLVEASIEFTKTHDLSVILDYVVPVEPDWQSLREDLNSLTDQAVEVRYPGMFADAEDAKQAVEIAKKVRTVVRTAFGLEI